METKAILKGIVSRGTYGLVDTCKQITNKVVCPNYETTFVVDIAHIVRMKSWGRIQELFVSPVPIYEPWGIAHMLFRHSQSDMIGCGARVESL